MKDFILYLGIFFVAIGAVKLAIALFQGRSGKNGEDQ